MKTTISTYIGVILIVLGIMLNIGVIAIHQQVVNARHYHSNVIYNIEASGLNTEVINDEIVEASSQGYKVEVTKIRNYEDKDDYKVSLSYKTGIPLLNLFKENKIEGYAR